MHVIDYNVMHVVQSYSVNIDECLFFNICTGGNQHSKVPYTLSKPLQGQDMNGFTNGVISRGQFIGLYDTLCSHVQQLGVE